MGGVSRWCIHGGRLIGFRCRFLAAKWNFVNFQGPTYSAIMMEFTTPPSYGTTTVNISSISKDGELVAASTKGSVEHTASTLDDVDLPEPTSAKFVWHATTNDGKAVEATIEGPLGDKLDRVDIMAEVPAIIKKIAGNVAGTKPYIYQVCLRPQLIMIYADMFVVFQEDDIKAESWRRCHRGGRKVFLRAHLHL